MSLEDLRGKIDEADTRIVRLIAERIRIAEEIGGEKKKQGKQGTGSRGWPDKKPIED